MTVSELIKKIDRFESIKAFSLLVLYAYSLSIVIVMFPKMVNGHLFDVDFLITWGGMLFVVFIPTGFSELKLGVLKQIKAKKLSYSKNYWNQM